MHCKKTPIEKCLTFKWDVHSFKYVFWNRFQKSIQNCILLPDQTYQFWIKLLLISVILTSSIQSNTEHLTSKPGLFIKRFVVSKLVVGFGEQDLCPWNSNIVY